MKIAEVTPLVMGTEWRNLTIVEVSTDEGVTGIGSGEPLRSRRSAFATARWAWTRWTGRRIVALISTRARVIAWRIQNVAYVLKR